MLQPEPSTVEHAAGEAGHAAAEGFNAGETIIGHVANTSLDHPLIHLPSIAGIDMSVTKHVFMLWVAAGTLLLLATLLVRRYARQERMIPRAGLIGLLEYVVLRMRDDIAEPAVGRKWVNTYTPLLLTLFLFIFTANAIGLLPIFDLLALLNHTVLHLPEDAFLTRLTHGGVTATGNFNVSAGLATITFIAIIIAGSRAHGFFGHWKNLVPHGVHPALAVALIPIEIMGMLVRPFALTMRLAANMSGGHIAVLAIISFVFIFTEMFGAWVGMVAGTAAAVGLAVPISLLEAMVVVPVQAYVFTLLTAVFIGMAIHAHH